MCYAVGVFLTEGFFLQYLPISSTPVTCGDLTVTGKSNSADSVNKNMWTNFPLIT